MDRQSAMSEVKYIHEKHLLIYYHGWDRIGYIGCEQEYYTVHDVAVYVLWLWEHGLWYDTIVF